MDVRIPFQVTAKGMESGNHASFEVTGMILLVKPVGNGLGSRTEEDIQEAAVFPEIPAELFWDGKDNMPVMAAKELGRNGFGSGRWIGNATGIAETGVAPERNDFVGTTMRAAKQGKPIGWIAAGKNLFDFRMDDGADFITGIVIGEGRPMVLKYFTDCNGCTHTSILQGEAGLCKRKCADRDKKSGSAQTWRSHLFYEILFRYSS